MEHINIENKIQKIRQSMELELKESGAMDLTGKALNEKAFNDIIDKNIAEIQRLEYLVADEMGVARDRYAANILMHHIHILNEMKDKKKFYFEPDSSKLEKGKEKEEGWFNKRIFKNGIGRLFGKTKRAKNPANHSIDNSR